MTRSAINRVERPVLATSGILILLVAMQIAVTTGTVSEHSMPTATAMAVALVNLLVSAIFYTALGATLAAAVLAFAVAAAVGIPLGLVLGSNRTADRAMSGLVEGIRPIPAIALMPVGILALGIGLELKVALAGLAALWPLLISTIAGVRDTDAMMVRAGRSFTWSRARIMAKIQLPAALPFIASGARQSISVGLVIVVTLELLGAREGLGEMIRAYSAAGRVDYVFAGVIATGLVGLGLHLLLGRAERRLMGWAPQYRKAAR